MKRFRLYVEDCDAKPQDGAELRPTVANVAGAYLDGATIVRASGLWRGQAEQTVIIEAIALNATEYGALRFNVFTLAERLRYLFDQTAVLVTEEDVTATLVTA